MVQQQLEVLEGKSEDDVTLREIQKILYSTEVRLPQPHIDHWLTNLTNTQEGFEVPEGAAVDEEETF